MSSINIVTIAELSKILKVKEKTLYQWAELGQIPSLKLNGCLRFDLNEIFEWVKSCKREPHSGYNPFTQSGSSRKGGDMKYGAVPER
ncbi:DNA-binding protein [candidate division WS5 bacterium]|uniref:DNA-binding protein n=1 Tax=candidate division WS5 bacterium TaxID=2093353 RepID=A0A419DFG4_9BACT|nr:MAG: DNA-binding protein [candidate division WS5 bacterium]